MTSATYKYTLKADSGYKSEQTGTISPERHEVVCAAFDGGLSDDLMVLRAAPDVLQALHNLVRLYEDDEGCRALPEYRDAVAAIAKSYKQ